MTTPPIARPAGMKWTDTATIDAPTTVKKVVPIECELVVRRKWTITDDYMRTEYQVPTETDLRRAAEAMGFELVRKTSERASPLRCTEHGGYGFRADCIDCNPPARGEGG